jgi:hypothetical protein
LPPCFLRGYPSVPSDPATPFAAFVARAAEGKNSLPRILFGTVIVVVFWFAGTLALLSADDYRGYGENYIRDTRLYRVTNKPFFISTPCPYTNIEGY